MHHYQYIRCACIQGQARSSMCILSGDTDAWISSCHCPWCQHASAQSRSVEILQCRTLHARPGSRSLYLYLRCMGPKAVTLSHENRCRAAHLQFQIACIPRLKRGHHFRSSSQQSPEALESAENRGGPVVVQVLEALEC